MIVPVTFRLHNSKINLNNISSFITIFLQFIEIYFFIFKVFIRTSSLLKCE